MFVFYVLLIGTVAAISDVWVELRAPRFVVHHHNALIRCEHNVDPKDLYKVVFFKDGQRIMQFVNGRVPPFELANFTGADIKLSQLTATTLTLNSMEFSAAGVYACEIALETPLFYKQSRYHEITVIVRQKHRPKIKIKHRKFGSNDVLEATCQSAPSYPAPHLTWFINNVKVDERYTTPNGLMHSSKLHHGVALFLTNSSLHYPLSLLHLTPNHTVEISCLSTIPSYASVADGYADTQNHSVTVNVVRLEPTPTETLANIIGPSLNSTDSSCNIIKQEYIFPGLILFLYLI